MNKILRLTAVLAGLLLASQAGAQITFYEREGFQGRSFDADRRIRDLERYGFNDRASSVVVQRERWEVCEDARFDGRCVVLRPGRYASLQAMGLNDRISSMREVRRDSRIDEHRYAPEPMVQHDYRRRGNERLYEATVTSVRAVVGAREQRCWIEREQIQQGRQEANVPAALAGAVIGGILGHQVGGGTGKDIATVGGAVAGAALGANIGRDRDGRPVSAQNVRRCEQMDDRDYEDARPEYWDVSYEFRGRDYRVQMTSPPGQTISVNRQGEPRD